MAVLDVVNIEWTPGGAFTEQEMRVILQVRTHEAHMSVYECLCCLFDCVCVRG